MNNETSQPCVVRTASPVHTVVVLGWLALLVAAALLLFGGAKPEAEALAVGEGSAVSRALAAAEPNWMGWQTEAARLAASPVTTPPERITALMATVRAGISLGDAQRAFGAENQPRDRYWRSPGSGPSVNYSVSDGWSCTLHFDAAGLEIIEVEWTCYRDLARNFVVGLLEGCAPAERQIYSLIYDVGGGLDEGRHAGKVIRAVNALVDCGEDSAVAYLRGYLSKSSRCPSGDRFYESSGALMLAALLFPCEFHPAGKLRDILQGPPSTQPLDADRDLWPSFPMAEVGSVPFRLTQGYIVHGSNLCAEGWWESSDVVLERYIATGRFREVPMLPILTPPEAARQLAASDRLARLEGADSVREWVLTQGMQALALAFTAAAAGLADATEYQTAAEDCGNWYTRNWVRTGELLDRDGLRGRIVWDDVAGEFRFAAPTP